MKKLSFVSTALAVFLFVSCEKDTPAPSTPAPSTPSTPTTPTTKNGYLWISMGDNSQLNNLQSLTYTVGTNTPVTLSDTAARNIFIYDGTGYYTNIPISGVEGTEIETCITLSSQTPLCCGFYNYYIATSVLATPKTNYGASTLTGTDQSACETKSINW